MVAATQLINVGRGSHEVAIDLASDQAQTLKSNSKVKVSLQPSTWVFWLFANNDPAVSAVTSNKQWQNAIRFGLDYKSILSVAGPGAYPDAGDHPVDVRGRAACEGSGEAERHEGEGRAAGVGPVGPGA